jgi:phage-related protein
MPIATHEAETLFFSDPFDDLLAVICEDLPPPSELPRVFIPVLGELRKARDSINGLPKSYDLLLKFMDVLNVALAPVRQLLELLEVVMSIKDCITGIVDALTAIPPDPSKVLECPKRLLQAFARLMAYIPPLPYIKSMVYLVSFLVDIIDALLDVFVELDAAITEWKNMRLLALRLQDIELLRLVDCRGQEFGITAVSLADVLKVIVPLLEMMLEPIARLVPDPKLKQMVKDLADARKTLNNVEGLVKAGAAAVEQLLLILHPLLVLIMQMRSIVVTVHNIVAPYFSLPPKLQKPTPSFSNF